MVVGMAKLVLAVAVAAVVVGVLMRHQACVLGKRVHHPVGLVAELVFLVKALMVRQVRVV
jgi:hypothetical protein